MYFLLKLTHARSTFPQDMTAEERVVMQQHIDYWSALAEKGVAIVVGPVLDPAGVWGVSVVEVTDAAAAQAIVDEDPVTKDKLEFDYRVLPMARALVRK